MFDLLYFKLFRLDFSARTHAVVFILELEHEDHDIADTFVEISCRKRLTLLNFAWASFKLTTKSGMYWIGISNDVTAGTAKETHEPCVRFWTAME